MVTRDDGMATRIPHLPRNSRKEKIEKVEPKRSLIPKKGLGAYALTSHPKIASKPAIRKVSQGGEWLIFDRC